MNLRTYRASARWRAPLGPVPAVLLLAAAIAAFGGCSRHRRTTRPVEIERSERNERVFETNEEAVKAGIYEEFVDSAALKRGEVVPAEPRVAEPAGGTSAPELISPGRVPDDVAMGYRVQLGAFNDMAGAQELAEKARSRLGGRYPVYVRYYSPYWKVQVGDCPDRGEAQRLQSYLRGNGYPDAFIVQSGIKR